MKCFLPVILCTILLSSCISERFPENTVNVMHAAGDFYWQRGRWPDSRAELAMGRDLKGHPLDVSQIRDVVVRPQAGGGAKIRWTEGCGLFQNGYEVTLPSPPTTEPATMESSR